jgi:putative membrane protein
MSLQKWTSSFLSPDDIKHIEAAIAKAEHMTSAEIVPMVVKQSATSGLVAPVVFFILSTCTYALDFHLAFLPSLIVLFVWLPVSALLSKLHFVRRWLTPRADLEAQVEARAEIEFHRLGLTNTQDRVGVLIFVSLMERHAVVLGDRAINEKIPQTAWSELLADLIKGLHAGDPAKGFNDAISHAADLLRMNFPSKKTNPNELCNKLIIKD